MWLACVALVALQVPESEPVPIVAPREWLVGSTLDGFRGNWNWPYFHPYRGPDAFFRKYLLDRDAPPPTVDDEGWETRAVDAEGWVDASWVWAYAAIESEEERVLLAKLDGATFLFVNGARFSGDRLGTGFGAVPIALRKGRNDVYVTGVWQRFRLVLAEPPYRAAVATWDLVTGDLVAGEIPWPFQLVFPVLNASTERLEGLHVHFGKVSVDGSTPRISEWSDGSTQGILPLGAVEGLGYVGPEGSVLPADMTETSMGLNVYAESDRPWEARTRVAFDVRPPSAPRRFVFRSDVDDSPQSYVLRPGNASRGSAPPRAIVLSLHSLGEDAFDQVLKHPPVSDVWIIAPDHRTEVGGEFVWEGWWWQDAMAALENVLDRATSGPRRPPVYVAGSGVWHDTPWNEPLIDGYIEVGAEKVALPVPETGRSYGASGHGAPIRIGDALRVDQLVDYAVLYEATCWTTEDRFLSVETSNVRRLTLWPPFSGACLVVDGESLGDLPAGTRSVSCVRTDDGWGLADPPGPDEQQVGCSGPFSAAYDNRFVMVYGTAGTDEEDRELLELARAEQQRWWALTGGLPLLLRDDAFGHRFWKDRVATCNVLLYGSASTNAAWDRLVGDGPIRVELGLAVVGDERFERDDLCALFVRPRADAAGHAVVAVIAETGPTGARLAYAVHPLGFPPPMPDYAVLSPDFLTPTPDANGVLAEGWFDYAWKLQD